MTKLEQDFAKNFEEIMDAVSDDLLISDGEGVVVRVSPSFERVYGLKKEEALGKTVFELEEKGYFRPSIIARVLEKKEKVTMQQMTKSNRNIVVTATPVYDENRKIKYVVSFSRDITEMVELQIKYSKLQTTVKRYETEISKLRRDANNIDIVTKSAEMEKIMNVIKQVAPYDVNVLLLGESGVGKTSLARKIHNLSERSEYAFVDINCAAIPENLLETELFGYEKGSFTGAHNKGKIGLIETAQNGTLFLDEISELPLGLQAKLLKAIQEKVITRVGGVKEIKVDFRLLAASNRDLDETVRLGLFRKDLFYRLNVVKINIPPLAERRDDIEPLIEFFIEKFNAQYGKPKHFSQEAMMRLREYSWPGNVREVSNVVERAYITSNGDAISVDDLPEEITSFRQPMFDDGIRGGLIKTVEDFESKIVNDAYNKFKTTTGVAEYLDISQPTASRKIAKYVKK